MFGSVNLLVLKMENYYKDELFKKLLDINLLLCIVMFDKIGVSV